MTTSGEERFTPTDVSVAIPSYGRDDVLVETVLACLGEREPPGQVIVVDQVPDHTPAVTMALQRLATQGRIQWETLRQPSQPVAMNHALRLASRPLVIFLDDDIVPAPGLTAAHALAHTQHPQAWAVAGQVLQPGEEPTVGRAAGKGFRADLDFRFSGRERAWVANLMSGNVSVRRERALAVGGFDENFSGGVAYRFDTEFARRILASGGRVLFEPSASIRHLRAQRGGTRGTGSHLSSSSPVHGMGDYYFALGAGLSASTCGYMLRRPLREISTRFHLRRPWFIPVKLLGEFRAFAAALSAVRRGPRLLPVQDLRDGLTLRAAGNPERR